jgi:DNA-binding MarR family transcriptional regulator
MDARDEGLSCEDYRRLAEFRHQIRLFLTFSIRAARQADLEPRQHQMLLALKGLPPEREATIGELAKRLQIHHNTAVELVNRLSDGGFVTRRRGEVDRRKVFVELTAKGDEVLDELTRDHLRELQLVGPELVRALDRLINE